MRNASKLLLCALPLLTWGAWGAVKNFTPVVFEAITQSTIDSTPIGQNTASAGSFTHVNVAGTTTYSASLPAGQVASYYKLGTWIMNASAGTDMEITFNAGPGFNSLQRQQGEAWLLVRSSNAQVAPNLSGSTLYSIGTAPVTSAKLAATNGSTSISNGSWDVYVNTQAFTVGTYTVTTHNGDTWSFANIAASDPGPNSSTVNAAGVYSIMDTFGNIQPSDGTFSGALNVAGPVSFSNNLNLSGNLYLTGTGSLGFVGGNNAIFTNTVQANYLHSTQNIVADVNMQANTATVSSSGVFGGAVTADKFSVPGASTSTSSFYNIAANNTSANNYSGGSMSLSGSVSAGGNVSAPTFIGALTGNASTASNFASAPSTCGANGYAYGVTSNGNAQCGNTSASLNNSSGYQYLPNGFIVQWVVGTSPVNGRGQTTTRLPITFPHGCLNAQVTVEFVNYVGTTNYQGAAFYLQPGGCSQNSVSMQYDVRADGAADSPYVPRILAIGW